MYWSHYLWQSVPYLHHVYVWQAVEYHFMATFGWKLWRRETGSEVASLADLGSTFPNTKTNKMRCRTIQFRTIRFRTIMCLDQGGGYTAAIRCTTCFPGQPEFWVLGTWFWFTQFYCIFCAPWPYALSKMCWFIIIVAGTADCCRVKVVQKWFREAYGGRYNGREARKLGINIPDSLLLVIAFLLKYFLPMEAQGQLDLGDPWNCGPYLPTLLGNNRCAKVGSYIFSVYSIQYIRSRVWSKQAEQLENFSSHMFGPDSTSYALIMSPNTHLRFLWRDTWQIS